MSVELIAVKKCGTNAPGTTFREPKHIARALVAIGKAKYANKAMESQPVVKSEAPAPEAPAPEAPAPEAPAPEAPAPEAPAPVATLPPAPKRTLSRKSSKEDEE